jgi:acyl carrier protein
MNKQELRDIVLATLTGIAPEVEAGELAPARPLRGQVDLDSMDWLNFLIGLNRRLDIEIPEADYRQLTTLDVIVDYLAAKLPA